MKRSDLKIAKRYARALFDSYGNSEVEAIKVALQSFAKTFNENEELRTALANPGYPQPQRMEALREIGHFFRQDDEKFFNFLALLLRNGRLLFVADIAMYFSHLVDELRSLLSLTVVSAFPLSDPEKEEIISRIQAEHGSLATIAWEIDPLLIGGLLIKSGDLILDNSIKGSLDKMRKSLLV